MIVVEAAGNGAQHLDDPIYGGQGPGFRPNRPNPFMRDGLDSGAVVVGAGAPPERRATARTARGWTFSNWGTAIDAQGWGREVATTGGLGRAEGATEPEDRWYTEGSAARRAPPRWWPARSPACRARCAPPGARR